jgi:hypothetical protein
MSKIIKIKLSTEHDKIDYLRDIIIDNFEKASDLKETMFTVDKLEVRGFDNSILEFGKILITFKAGIGISSLIITLTKAIVEYMKSTKGNVTIIHKDEEIKIENFTEKQIINIIESIYKTKSDQDE